MQHVYINLAVITSILLKEPGGGTVAVSSDLICCSPPARDDGLEYDRQQCEEMNDLAQIYARLRMPLRLQDPGQRLMARTVDSPLGPDSTSESMDHEMLEAGLRERSGRRRRRDRDGPLGDEGPLLFGAVVGAEVLEAERVGERRRRRDAFGSDEDLEALPAQRRRRRG